MALSTCHPLPSICQALLSILDGKRGVRWWQGTARRARLTPPLSPLEYPSSTVAVFPFLAQRFCRMKNGRIFCEMLGFSNNEGPANANRLDMVVTEEGMLLTLVLNDLDTGTILLEGNTEFGLFDISSFATRVLLT